MKAVVRELSLVSQNWGKAPRHLRERTSAAEEGRLFSYGMWVLVLARQAARRSEERRVGK